jgi:hypothetical protein
VASDSDDNHVLIDDNDPELQEPVPAAPIPNITYNLAILSLAELAKAARSQRPQARFIDLLSNLVWNDFWAQIKIKISDVLFPGEAIVEDNAFEVFFSFPRHVKDPLPLTTSADYSHLIKNALKIKKDPAVKIVVKQLKKARSEVVSFSSDNILILNNNFARTRRMETKRMMSLIPMLRMPNRADRKLGNQGYVFSYKMHAACSTNVSMSRLLVHQIFCLEIFPKSRTSSAFALGGHVTIQAAHQRFVMSLLMVIIFR